jgi:hypothetical protein
MVDTDTFLTELYVRVDDFAKSHLSPLSRPGPQAALTCSEVVTLVLFGQWAQFDSESAFYRYARRHLRRAFPKLPVRTQFNRLVRAYHDAIVAFALHMADELDAANAPYEALDGMGLAVRNSKRRGSGWLAGQADIGKSNRLGWYNGCYLLTAVNPRGVFTGWGLGAASTNDRVMAETFFAARRFPHPRLTSVGRPARGDYVIDKGFGGRAWEQRWAEAYGAHVIAPPQKNSRRKWPQALRRWHAGLRQIVETVHEHLLHTFRLEHERPHDLGGLQARVAATIGLHNFCMGLNQKLGRPLLAFADLLDW